MFSMLVADYCEGFLCSTLAGVRVGVQPEP